MLLRQQQRKKVIEVVGRLMLGELQCEGGLTKSLNGAQPKKK
jgi:hypothetical protein